MPVVAITEPAAYKVGSTWTFVLTRKNPDGDPIDLTDLTVRATFRAGSVTGTEIATLTEGDGIAIIAADGQVTLTIDAVTSATAPAGTKVFFDVEMVSTSGHVWQSPTYRIKTEAEVTA
jgi:hypothetical protein